MLVLAPRGAAAARRLTRRRSFAAAGRLRRMSDATGSDNVTPLFEPTRRRGAEPRSQAAAARRASCPLSLLALVSTSSG
jgi:hypothetical protein